jgi:hypothetical protein
VGTLALSLGYPQTDKYRINYYMDGRPAPTHNGFRKCYSDELDAMFMMGGGTSIGGSGNTSMVNRWNWSDGEWAKPQGYVSDTNYGTGVSGFGEMWNSQAYIDTGTSMYGGDSSTYPNSTQSISQPMTKLIGQNKIIIIRAVGTLAQVYEYIPPGPSFRVIGTMTGIKNQGSFPGQRVCHDPVRNRLLWNSMTYVDGYPWAYVEDQTKAELGYIDLTQADTGNNMFVSQMEAWANCLPLRQLTSNDCIVYDEHNDHYLMLAASRLRDPRTSGKSTTGGNYDQRPPAMDNAPFMTAYAIDADNWANVTPITIAADPIYGLPPGQSGGDFFNLRYIPELKVMAYVSKNAPMHSPTVSEFSVEGDYGVDGDQRAAGPYVWIFRVG